MNKTWEGFLIFDHVPVGAHARYDFENEMLVLQADGEPIKITAPGNGFRLPVVPRERPFAEYLKKMVLYATEKKEPTVAPDYRWAHTHAASVFTSKIGKDSGPGSIIGSADTQRVAREYVRNNVKAEGIFTYGDYADQVDYNFDRCYLRANRIPLGMIIFAPLPEFFGVMPVDGGNYENGFGMAFMHEFLLVYKVE
jgi:hypothetical protein